MMTLPTWKGRSRFKYEGSVKKQGTQIWFGQEGFSVTVSNSQYTKLLDHFKGKNFRWNKSR